MKITIFDGSFRTTAFIRRLVKGLIANGHQVTIIGFNESNPQPLRTAKYQSLGSNSSKLRLLITSLQLAVASKKMQIIVTTCRYILKGDRKQIQQQNLKLALKKLKPDVVHVQWPSLLTWMEPYMPNKHFKVLLSQRGYHTNVRPFIDDDNGNYLQKWYPKLDGLHSVSKAISAVGKKIGQPHSKIDNVVYTGLPLDMLDYKPISHKRGQPLKLLSVGRPHWIKDYPTALKACNLLKEKEIPFQYTIIGAAGNEELLFLIDVFNLRDFVTLTGKIAQEEVYKKMETADVLLLPSIAEGLPNVAVEAMALGLPVISTNCGGVEELIIDSKQGWLVPKRNSKALAAAVEQLNNLSLEQVNTITLTARENVERQHTVEKMVNGMMNLYQNTKIVS